MLWTVQLLPEIWRIDAEDTKISFTWLALFNERPPTKRLSRHEGRTKTNRRLSRYC